MEKPSHVVTRLTDTPTVSSLRTAEEIADKIKCISACRLRDLADSGYAPHCRVDGGEPLFHYEEIRRWIGKNLTERCDGRSMADLIRVVVPAGPLQDKPPEALMNIPNLQQMQANLFTPGVYFLCKGDDVVYVGQSVSPGSRVAQHGADKEKDFDRAYLFPVPAYDLDNVEAAFILHLMPAQQGGLKHGKRMPVRPTMTMSQGEVFETYEINCSDQE